MSCLSNLCLICPDCSSRNISVFHNCLKSTNMHIPSLLLPQGVAGKSVGQKVFFRDSLQCPDVFLSPNKVLSCLCRIVAFVIVNPLIVVEHGVSHIPKCYKSSHSCIHVFFFLNCGMLILILCLSLFPRLVKSATDPSIVSNCCCLGCPAGGEHGQLQLGGASSLPREHGQRGHAVIAGVPVHRQHAKPQPHQSRGHG